MATFLNCPCGMGFLVPRPREMPLCVSGALIKWVFLVSHPRETSSWVSLYPRKTLSRGPRPVYSLLLILPRIHHAPSSLWNTNNRDRDGCGERELVDDYTHGSGQCHWLLWFTDNNENLWGWSVILGRSRHTDTILRRRRPPLPFHVITDFFVLICPSLKPDGEGHSLSLHELRIPGTWFN